MKNGVLADKEVLGAKPVQSSTANLNVFCSNIHNESSACLSNRSDVHILNLN